MKEGKLGEKHVYYTDIGTTPQRTHGPKDVVKRWSTQFYLDHGTKLA
jgi:hypothetical protein